MESMVKADNLVVMLGGKTVLEGITFNAFTGELTGIIGPNGAGKTTLLRAILGLIPLQHGTLSVLGSGKGKIRDVRPAIGYMPQRQSFEKEFPYSASDVVATGLLSPATMFKPLNDRTGKVKAALQSVGMEGYLGRPFRNLSGGEQQRILLARALVRKPKLLLLDEPNAGLDFPAQQEFTNLLENLKQDSGLTIILVSHDLLSVASIADQLVCINKTMHIHGKPAEVLNSRQLDEAYRCQFDLLSKGSEGKGCRH